MPKHLANPPVAVFFPEDSIPHTACAPLGEAARLRIRAPRIEAESNFQGPTQRIWGMFGLLQAELKLQARRGGHRMQRMTGDLFQDA